MGKIYNLIYSSSLKKFLYSDQGLLLRPLHTVLVNSMELVINTTHRFQMGKYRSEDFDTNVTIVVKTFLRPKTAQRFIRRARQIFGGTILMVDDSPKPLKTRDSKTRVLALPFNSGISVGRNRALEEVTTKYTLITDDDIIFTCASTWDFAYEYLEANPQVDGVAAVTIHLPKMYTDSYVTSPLYKGTKEPIFPEGTNINGYEVSSKVGNVFLARTESLRKVPWDNRLKILEHTDFFSAAAGVLTFVQADNIPVYHARTPWNKKYNEYRGNTKEYSTYLGKKWAAIARGEAKPQGH